MFLNCVRCWIKNYTFFFFFRCLSPFTFPTGVQIKKNNSYQTRLFRTYIKTKYEPHSTGSQAEKICWKQSYYFNFQYLLNSFYFSSKYFIKQFQKFQVKRSKSQSKRRSKVNIIFDNMIFFVNSPLVVLETLFASHKAKIFGRILRCSFILKGEIF